LSAILRIALGAALLAAADSGRLAALMDPHPDQHYALHVLWLAGGFVLGDGLWRIGTALPRARTRPVQSQ
jgi:hypothetical protein